MLAFLRFKVRRLLIWSIRPFVRLLKVAEREASFEEVENLKMMFQSVGTHVKVSPSAVITWPIGMAVANNVHIGDDCYINAEGGIQIQDNVHISRRVTIYASDHDYRANDLLPYGPFRKWRQTIIERNVWIGMNACILPGVRIGEGAIVGVGCVVAKDVPPLSIVGQAPRVEIEKREEAHYQMADASGNYGGVDGRAADSECRPLPLPAGRISEPDITFVLTTGRSGSKSIVESFNRTSEVEARHEPRIQLVQWSTQLAHGEKSQEEIRKDLEELFLNTSVYRSDKVYLESDQKHFNLVPLLKELLPSSKYIWLTRNGRDVVSSATGRGWYSDDSHPVYNRIPYYFHKHRLQGDLCGAVDPLEWEKMCAFEKNCWYWAFVNSTIRGHLTDLPEKDWIHVRLEELSGETQNIASHIGVPGYRLSEAHVNGAFYPINKTSTWSDKEEALFTRWCRREMEAVY